MNIFSVVRFPNKPCQGNDASASNGTCYAADECSERNGAAAGSCAGGYGVCCTCKYVLRLKNFLFISHCKNL